MRILKKIFSFFNNRKRKENKEVVSIIEQTEEKLVDKNIVKIANHEAAHGIVWYLFRKNWIVNQLTIERENLPNENMNGALHISANFNIEKETSIERANEIFAIVLSGMIGQNIDIINKNPDFVYSSRDYSNILDRFNIDGCGEDFDIAKKHLTNLSNASNETENKFIRFKIFDLVSLFQEHDFVQQLHIKLSKLILEKRTLTGQELISFFEENNFS